MKNYRESADDARSDLAGQVARREARVHMRMASIAHKFAVISSKGGVGKSAVTANLAVALALQGRKVGVLDADINRSRVAGMLGVRDQTFMLGAGGIVPTVGPLGIKVVSMDLPLTRGATPVTPKLSARKDRHTWLGTVEASALDEFLTDTRWGELDFLLIDLPPGRERYSALHDLLPDCDGALFVTVPSGVAERTVKRSIVLARAERAPLGGALRPLFRDVPVLGRIPFDTRVARYRNRSVPFVTTHPNTAAARAFMELAARVSGGWSSGARTH